MAPPKPAAAALGWSAAAEDFASAAESRSSLRAQRCYYLAPGLRVELCARTGGHALVASAAMAAGEIVLVEQGALPEVPAYLHPRSAADVPLFVWGFPTCVVPAAVFDACPMLMRAMRYALNAYGRLYAFGSVVNHSCCPNVERIMRRDGLSAFVSCVPIAAGEELTSSYSDAALGGPRWLRQLALFHRFGFWCSCRRCADGGAGGAAHHHYPSWQASLEAYRRAAADDELFLRSGAQLNARAASCSYPRQSSREHWRHALPCIAPIVALQAGALVLGGLAARRVRWRWMHRSSSV